jgi:large subunit ribosomal protein L28
MSRICALTGMRRMKKNSIAIERSKVTKRTKGFANVNLHTKIFATENLGNIKLKISNRTLRTIEKYGGLENYLLATKRKQLTEKAKILRKKIYVKNV